jgi:hypothetical protein
MGLIENVKSSIDGMGQVELSGIKLESADPRLLDVGALDLDKHVAMQPAAIAYYGAMKKEVSRRLSMLKRGFNRWEKKQWALAKAAVTSGTTSTWKPTLADIESRFIADNERELEEWDKKLDRAEEEADTLDAWYEAWRQKSFSLRDHVSIDEDERHNAGSSMRGGENEDTGGFHGRNTLTRERIREVLEKRRSGGAS